MSGSEKTSIQSKLDKIRSAAHELSDVEDFTTDIEIRIEQAITEAEQEVHQVLVRHKDQMQSYANQFREMKRRQRKQYQDKAVIEERLSNAKTKEVNAKIREAELDQEIDQLKTIRYKLETEIEHHKRKRDETEAELNDLKRERLSDAW